MKFHHDGTEGVLECSMHHHDGRSNLSFPTQILPSVFPGPKTYDRAEEGERSPDSDLVVGDTYRPRSPIILHNFRCFL